MIKKIPIAQLCLGMHLHGLCGPWTAHPFWRTKFVLTDPKDLDALRASPLTECLIDTAKGLDIPDQAAKQAVVSLPDRGLPTPLRSTARSTAARASAETEAAAAARLFSQARGTVASLFQQARMGSALDLVGCAPLVYEMAAAVRRSPAALTNLLLLRSHDDYTFTHSVAVCTLMLALARRMGFGDATSHEVGLAGLLHDVGKATIPPVILNKPTRLDDAEYAVVRTHPERGHDLLRQSGCVSNVVLDVCLNHHERQNGSGYPRGLGGASVSLYAKMAAVCDVYDAITTDRCYSAGIDAGEAIARMAAWAKAGQLDKDAFHALVGCLGIHPVGSLVRLRSQRLGLVVAHNESALGAPRVKAFYSLRSEEPVPVETIDLSRPGCRDRIVGRDSNAQWRFPFLKDLLDGPSRSLQSSAA